MNCSYHFIYSFKVLNSAIINSRYDGSKSKPILRVVYGASKSDWPVFDCNIDFSAEDKGEFLILYISMVVDFNMHT